MQQALLKILEGTVANVPPQGIARRAIERKLGARGLRQIMEDIMLDLMYQLPSLKL